MTDVEVPHLEMGGEYTDDQLRRLEDTYRIFRLRSTSTGLRDYIQRDPRGIYSLKKNGDGTLKVVEHTLLGVLHDVEQ